METGCTYMLLYLHACVAVICAYMCSSVYRCVEVRGQCWVSPSVILYLIQCDRLSPGT